MPTTGRVRTGNTAPLVEPHQAVYAESMSQYDSFRLPVKLLTLSFQPSLEGDFRHYYADRSSKQIRFVFILAIVVLGAFGILDRLMAPDTFQQLWRIRFIYTAPVLVIPFILSLFQRFDRYMQWLLFVAALGTGAGVVTIITIAGDPLSYLYYAGLMLIMMFIFGFSRLRFPLAVSASFILIILYEIAVTIIAPVSRPILINNNFFLIAATVVGIASNYAFEYSVRRTFFLNRLLKSEREKLAGMYDQLEERVNERTAALQHANDQLNRLALYDSLTGLYNRRSLNIHLQEIILSARREPKRNPMALLYIDLDFFKDANDTYGHDAGDEVLRQMADRIRNSIRKSDYPCRLGGDEVIVFLSTISNDEDAAIVAEKLLQALAEPFHVRDYQINLSASIGVSIFPRDGESSPELIRAADSALKAAKKQRRTYVFYADSLQQRASERIRMIGQLRRALERHEFFLLYHPIVDSAGVTVGAEALLRWQSPDRGVVPPLDFIPVLEDTGLMPAVGTWVLETACNDAKIWSDNGLDLWVAVNVSAQQFNSPDFEAIVERVIHESKLPGERLELEITESLLLDNVAETAEKLHSIRQLGLSFSVDDFGTGYSSLSYLKDLPVSVLKIDASFVRGLPSSRADAAIVSAVSSMADGLDLRIVAEGVETDEQCEFLRATGCDTFQGYLYSKPIERDEIMRFVNRVSET